MNSHYDRQYQAEQYNLDKNFLRMAIFLIGNQSNVESIKSHLCVNGKHLIKIIDINKSFLDIELKGIDPEKNYLNHILISLNSNGLIYLRKILLTKNIH
jgi:hypothetical protein